MLKLMNKLRTYAKGGLLSALLGALLGLICADMYGCIVGTILGVFFIDKSFFKKLKLPEHFPMSSQSVSMLFQCFGKFAKEDGFVSEQEATFMKEQMLEWGFCDDTRKHLKEKFNIGRDSSDTFENLFEKFISQLELTKDNFRCDIIHTFTSLAFSNGAIDNIKRSRLQYIANRLERPDYLLKIMALFDSIFEDDNQQQEQSENKKQKSNKDSSSKDKNNHNTSNTNENALDKYYKILEISPNATDDEVKKAWRKKAQEFHPDKVQGTGLPNAFVEYATEEIKKINEAYDKICAARK